MNIFLQKNQKGFVILFTIIIATIILMIGLGIFSVATRQTVLSGTAREAQYAFYAADAGVECALFADGLLTGAITYTNTSDPFDCGASILSVDGDGVSDPYTFDVDISNDPADRSCAHVTVFVVPGQRKRVIAQGYNMCTTALLPDTKNPLLTERVLNTTYDYGSGPSVAPTGTPISSVPSATTLPPLQQNPLGGI